MTMNEQGLPSLVKEVRRQTGISQKGLDQELDPSFVTVNLWGTGRCLSSNSARAQLDGFCARMRRRGKLVFPRERG